jgi:nucleoid DNA-binding protein
MKFDNKDHKKIVHKVSIETFTEKQIVEAVIDSYYEYVKNSIEKCDRLDINSFPRIMIPVIGCFKADQRKITHAIRKHGDNKEQTNGEDSTTENQ